MQYFFNLFFKFIKVSFRFGFGWAVIGALLCWVTGTGNTFFYIGLAMTVVTFINRYLTKKMGYKCNIFTVAFKKGMEYRALNNVQKGNQANLQGIKEPHGIILGRDNKKKDYFIQDEDASNSVAIFGTPGTGKSQGIIIPTLLSYGSKSATLSPQEQPSCFVVDVKGELLQNTYKHRHNVLGRNIKYLSFGEQIIPEETSCVFDPFSVIEFAENEIQGITEIANALIPISANEKNPYFPNQARSLLAGLLYSMYKSSENLTFADALKNICSYSIKDLIERYCIGNGTPEKPMCEKGWMILSSFYSQSSKSPEPESFANVRDTMLGPIRLVATNDNIINAFDTRYGNPLKPSDIWENDIYICVKEQYLDADQPGILNLIVNQFLSYFSRIENNTNKRILCVLDEFPRLGHLKKVTEGINLYRSKGIRFLICAQSIEQLKEKYGDHHFGVLMDGMGTTLVLRAVGSSAQYFSGRIGRYDKMVASKSQGVNAQTTNFGQGVSSGTSVSEQERDIFRPSYFENELASNGKLMIIAQDGYKVADVAFAYNDPIFSAQIK